MLRIKAPASISSWANGVDRRPRQTAWVRLDYRLLDDGPTFMVTDADCSDVAQSDLVGRALKRTDVVGQPISQHVFALCDAVLSLDARVAELLGNWKPVTR
jgi:hypothetical protein